MALKNPISNGIDKIYIYDRMSLHFNKGEKLVPHCVESNTLELFCGGSMGTRKNKGPLLKRIFEDQDIALGEILYHETGHESLLNEALFIHVDPNTEEWRHSLKSATAKEVRLEVYKVLRNASTVSTLFGSLGRDLKDLCIEQSQIAKFVRIYGRTNLMHNCRSTLFLTEVDNEPCVVEVRSYPGVDQRVPHIFSAGVHHIWKFLGGPTHRLQVVVPIPEK